MKKLIFSLAAAAALLAGCQAEKTQIIRSEGTVNVKMTAIPQETRTSIAPDNSINWGKGEYVMMYYNDGTDRLVKSDESSADAAEGSSTATFDFTISPAQAESYTIGGAYPASAVKTTTDGKEIEVEIPGVQNATAVSYDPAAFIMAIKPENVAEIPAQWQAWFRKATALNKVTLKGVKSDIYAVEFTCEGKNFAGKATIDLTTGETTGYKDNTSSVKVQYATALAAGDMDIWFTTWESAIAQGETLTIKAFAADGYYSKTITAKSAGIKFVEGGLNLLSVDFSAVEFTKLTFKDWAVEFAKLYDVWQSNTNANGFVIPEKYTFTLGAVTYDKSKAYYVACKALSSLYDGAAFTMDIPAAKSYKWSDNPYYPNGSLKNIFVNLDFLRNYANRQMTYALNNDVWANLCGYSNSTSGTPSVAGKGYNGDCALECHLLMMVRFYKYLLDNGFESGLASIENDIHIRSGLYKETDFSASSSAFAFASAGAPAQTLDLTAIDDWTASASEGWISVSPASGKGSFDGAASISISVADNSGSARNGSITFASAGDTYTVTVSQDAVGITTIKDFATEYVKLLDIWADDANICNMPAEMPYCAIARNNVRSIPMDTKFSVKGTEYNISQALETAIRSFMLLIGYDGNNTTKSGAGKIPDCTAVTMSERVPSNHNYGINYWYLDNSINGGGLRHNGKPCEVALDWLINFCSRNINYALVNTGQWANLAGYTGGQLAGYGGVGTPARLQMALLRTFKMLLDNNIDNTDADKTVIKTYLSDKIIDSTVYDNTTYD